MPNKRKAGKKFIGGWVTPSIGKEIRAIADKQKVSISDVMIALLESSLGVRSDGTKIKRGASDDKE